MEIAVLFALSIGLLFLGAIKLSAVKNNDASAGWPKRLILAAVLIYCGLLACIVALDLLTR